MWRSLHPRKVWYVIFPFYQGVVLIQIYCLVCLFLLVMQKLVLLDGCSVEFYGQNVFSSCFYLREIYFLEKNCHSKIEVLVNCFVLRWCLVVLVNIYIAMCHALVYTSLFSIVSTFVVTVFPPNAGCLVLSRSAYFVLVGRYWTRVCEICQLAAVNCQIWWKRT